MAKGLVFGVTNGIITMLALITGMYAGKVEKVGIIAAILAILIADPLSDAYSMYISEKNNNNRRESAYDVGKEAFLSQFILQFVFLMIIVFTPTILSGLAVCYLFGLISILTYAFVQKSTFKEVIVNLSWIISIITITYFSDVLVHKYYN